MIYTKVNTIFNYNEENETKKEKIKLENRFLSIKECESFIGYDILFLRFIPPPSL